MSEAEPHPELETLLQYIRRTRGFDFTGYKRPSLTRRIRKRMVQVGCDSFAEYQDYLEVHPDEFEHLFNTILINVTSFFRDKDAWEYVQESLVPRIVAEKLDREPVRVWVAGCAGGHEAYTTAIVLAESLGLEAFKDRAKIYATDVDDDALAQARQAAYKPADVESVPQPLREKYFEQTNGNLTFRKDLRRAVIFGRNDLVKDAPISRIDLLVCRNTLMYFNAETQSRILGHFHFALSPKGYLFLGKGEMLLTRGNIFNPVDLRRRVFSKVQAENNHRHETTVEFPAEAEVDEMVSRVRLRESAFDAAPVAFLAVSLGGTLTLANDAARALFRLSQRDLGRPIQDLEVSYRPVELRSLLEQAYSERRVISVKQVEWTGRAGAPQALDVVVTPLQDTNGALLGANVAFLDVTRYRRLQEDLERSRQDLETAYEELQSTIEELETTNEELQSTNEELETTNEELQSTNEELETMNEELQSTNEELETMNTELRQRTLELNYVNSYMESVLASLKAGVAVLNRDLMVEVWNVMSEDLWGLRAEEVRGKNFLNLDIGLPVGQLRKTVRACLNQESEFTEVTVQAVNRRGRSIVCRVTASPLRGRDDVPVQGVILLMEEVGQKPRSDADVQARQSIGSDGGRENG